MGTVRFKPSSGQGNKIAVVIGEQSAGLGRCQSEKRFIIKASLFCMVEMDHIIILCAKCSSQSFPNMFVKQQSRA